MSNIEKIRQEIERQLEYFKGKEDDTWDDCDNYTDEDAMWYQGHWKMCSRLLTFIDSLPEEPLDDLEQAAARYERENRQSVLSSVDIVNAFIEGAKWQKEQDEDRLNEELIKAHLNGVMTGDRIAREESQMPMPEDTVIFQKGVAEGRRMEREELPRWKKGPADSAIRTRDYWPVSNAPVLGKPETRDYLIVKRGKSMLLAFHAEEGDYYLSTEELDKIPTE